MKLCPICRRKTIHQYYYDDGYPVERVEKCTLGHYEESWSYGRSVLILDKWHVAFTDHNYMTNKLDIAEANKNWAEFHKRLKIIRKRKAKK